MSPQSTKVPTTTSKSLAQKTNEEETLFSDDAYDVSRSEISEFRFGEKGFDVRVPTETVMSLVTLFIDDKQHVQDRRTIHKVLYVTGGRCGYQSEHHN